MGEAGASSARDPQSPAAACVAPWDRLENVSLLGTAHMPVHLAEWWSQLGLEPQFQPQHFVQCTSCATACGSPDWEGYNLASEAGQRETVA